MPKAVERRALDALALAPQVDNEEEKEQKEKQQQRQHLLCSAAQQYMLQHVEESRLQLEAERHEMVAMRHRVQRQRNSVRSLLQALDHLEDCGRYVATVQAVLGRRLVKVKLGHEVLVVPTAPGLRLRPNCRVGVRLLSRGEMLVYRRIGGVQDPLLSLMLVQKDTEATYEMIGGLDEQIRSVREVVELPLLHPELFEAVGIEQPKGVLLYGPPGTGKTLLARAVAHHSRCTFLRLSGTELVQKYVGEGARLLRELFVMARERAPAIIFLDEVDSIGSKQNDKAASTELAMVELLNQVDGFEPTQSIKILLATNRIDTLDEALLRPGRIDRKILCPAPGAAGRAAILRVHSTRMSLGRCVDFKEIAALTPGASGAELRLLCQEAAFSALRDSRSYVRQQDFVQRVARVMADLSARRSSRSGVK